MFNHYALAIVLTIVWGMPALAQDLPLALDREISFTNDVHAILAEKCFKCHAGDKRRGGLSMDSRETLLEGSEFGPVVTVGESASSRLIEVVSGLDPEMTMPPKGPALSDTEISILRGWIDQGLAWDLDIAPPGAPERPLSLRDVTVPENDGLHGSDHPVDRFVRATFDAAGIEVPEVTGDRAFARRAYLDGIGLLPTEDELNFFLAWRGDDKRDTLTNALLNRDRDYAEHWMTFWNDHLRNDFVGTGFIDGGRKQITDWLYDALAQNKPYDAFTRELVSPVEGTEGFTNGIVWRGVTAASQVPPMQAARSVSQVFLGANLKCASCHDSFVNRWKLADAYSVAAVYATEPLEMARCDVPMGKTASPAFLWPELGELDADAPREERMRQLAELVTLEENGRFTRTYVNRVWAVLFGRGLVEPLDEMDRPAWNEDLLDYLAGEFIASGYDTRALLHLLMTSKAYQLEPDRDPDGDAYVFRGPLVRRLSAEQFMDGISRVTGVWQPGEPKFRIPFGDDDAVTGVRAWRVPFDTLTRALGRPNREQVVTRRERAFTTLQLLEVLNGEQLAGMMTAGAAALKPELPADPGAAIETLFVRALQRPPNPDELSAAASLMGEGVSREGLEDALWAIAVLPEFQLIY